MTTVNNKLEMVNAVLLRIGESAVNSLENSRAVRNVLHFMDREKRRILTNKGNGYSFNRYDFKPIQDVNGHYPVPENTLYVKATGTASLTIRDGRLFDTAANTYDNIYFKDVLLLMNIDYDDLPALADEFIVAATTYEYKKSLGFAQAETNEAFGIRSAIEGELNEQEIYQIQADPNNNRFRNSNVYTDETSRNHLKRI